jgi:hypothetical protein
MQYLILQHALLHNRRSIQVPPPTSKVCIVSSAVHFYLRCSRAALSHAAGTSQDIPFFIAGLLGLLTPQCSLT